MLIARILVYIKLHENDIKCIGLDLCHDGFNCPSCDLQNIKNICNEILDNIDGRKD